MIWKPSEVLEKKEQECPCCHRKYTKVILEAVYCEIRSVESSQESENIVHIIRCINVRMEEKENINQEKKKLEEFVKVEFEKGNYGIRELDCNELICPYCGCLQFMES